MSFDVLVKEWPRLCPTRLGDEKLARVCAASIKRRAEAKTEVASALEHSKVSRRVRDLTEPNSRGIAVRRAGVALIVAPDPVTTVTGAVMVAASYALKDKEPASLKDLASATQKVLRDIRSLSV